MIVVDFPVWIYRSIIIRKNRRWNAEKEQYIYLSSIREYMRAVKSSCERQINLDPNEEKKGKENNSVSGGDI